MLEKWINNWIDKQEFPNDKVKEKFKILLDQDSYDDDISLEDLLKIFLAGYAAGQE